MKAYENHSNSGHELPPEKNRVDARNRRKKLGQVSEPKKQISIFEKNPPEKTKAKNPPFWEKYFHKFVS